MAKDKTSFILYADQRSYFDKLSDEEAGRLIKHIFSYVNDENPDPIDRIIDLSFEPIKLQLKRDLKKYEKVVDRNRNNGKLGGRPKKQDEPKKPSGLFQNPTKPKKADNDNDNDNVTDNVINSNKTKTFNFLKSLIELGVDEQVAKDWILVRKKKAASNTLTSLNGFIKQVEKSGLTINECATIAVENNWAGFKAEWDYVKKEKPNTPKGIAFN